MLFRALCLQRGGIKITADNNSRQTLFSCSCSDLKLCEAFKLLLTAPSFCLFIKHVVSSHQFLSFHTSVDPNEVQKVSNLQQWICFYGVRSKLVLSAFFFSSVVFLASGCYSEAVTEADVVFLSLLTKTSYLQNMTEMSLSFPLFPPAKPTDGAESTEN